MKPLQIAALLSLLLECSAASRIAGQALVFPRSGGPALQSAAPALRVSSNLVLVPVVALDAKNGLPDQTLNQADFELSDNGRPISITTFDKDTSTRPLALWFVVQCTMNDFPDAYGSGFYRGRIQLLAPALKDLEAKDTVAVAHWCDNGDATLDLLPTAHVQDALVALERVLAASYDAPDHERTGELALQKTLQLIVDATRSFSSEPLPVVIFLYGDHSGMPKSEADRLIGELLETYAIAFGLRDLHSHGPGFLLGEQKEVAHYIAAQTGGQYLAVSPETYANGLEQILKLLHFRYELGFTPAAMDGKRHNLRVQLASSAKRRHPGLRLRYRLAYVPAPPH